MIADPSAVSVRNPLHRLLSRTLHRFPARLTDNRSGSRPLQIALSLANCPGALAYWPDDFYNSWHRWLPVEKGDWLAANSENAWNF